MSTSPSGGRNYISCTLILVWVFYVVFAFPSGERIPANDGAGWDGQSYVYIVQNIDEAILKRNLWPNVAERMLPSLIVWSTLKLSGLDASMGNIQLGFFGFGVLCVLLSAALWRKIAVRMGLRTSIEIIGLVAILINFPFLKLMPYYPTLTDQAALLLGMLAIYGFLEERAGIIWLAFLLTLFTWPSGVVTLPFLLIFSGRRYTGSMACATKTQYRIIKFILGVMCLPMALYVLAAPRFVDRSAIYDPLMSNPDSAVIGVVMGSVFTVVLLYYGIGRTIGFNIVDAPRFFYRNLVFRNLALVLAALAVWQYFISAFNLPRYGVSVKSFFLENMLQHQLLQPGSFPLMHIIYFGPILIFTVLSWDRIAKVAIDWGPGFILFFFASVVLLLDPESRHAMLFYPSLIVLTLKVMNDGGMRPAPIFYIVFVLLSIIASKIWFEINTAEFLLALDRYPPNSVEIHQRYFMNFGLYMDYSHYIIQSALAIVGGVLLAFAIRHRSRRSILPANPH